MRSTPLARRLCFRLGDVQQRSNGWRHRAYQTSHASAGRLGVAAVLGASGIGLFVHEGSRATAQEKEDASLLTRKRIQIFSGTAHPKLAQAVAAELGISLAAADISKFKCGETAIEIKETVRDNDVFVINPTCNPNPNDYLMEVLIIMDACRRAGAGRITAVLPIFGYARQDKKDASRAPITAKLVADMLEVAGANRVIVVDLHAPQIQGFVSFPIDNLYATPLLLEYIKTELIKTSADEVVIVSPDAGGAKRAEKIASKLHAGLAIFSKKRVAAGVVDSMILVGDVKGKKCILVDDMCDTGGTLVKAAQQLKDAGATEVLAAVTHGVFSAPAIENINNSVIDRFLVTDTIAMDENVKLCPKIRVLSVAPLIAAAIRRVHEGQSVSYLFEHVPDHAKVKP